MGLTLDYSEKDLVQIDARLYIKKALESYSKEFKKPAKTPVADDIFNVREGATPLAEDKRKRFHSIFALLLWIGTMARPDILVPLIFVGKRTTKANEDDPKKLETLLSYISGTTELLLTLRANAMKVIKWWTDSSLAVHPVIKSHPGLMGTLGRRAIFAKSVTQKLKATSSIEE